MKMKEIKQEVKDEIKQTILTNDILESYGFEYDKPLQRWSKWYCNEIDECWYNIIISENREMFTFHLLYRYYKPTGVRVNTLEKLQDLWTALTDEKLTEK